MKHSILHGDGSEYLHPIPRKKIIALILLPLVVALHVYLIWLGGGWRFFALVEAGFGIFLALILRDVKRLSG